MGESMANDLHQMTIEEWVFRSLASRYERGEKC